MHLRIAVAIAVALVAPGWALAEEDSLCARLRALSAGAAEGKVVRVRFTNVVGGDFFTACGPTDQSDVKAYCDDVVSTAGLHGLHAYPWRVRDCLRNGGVRPISVTRRSKGQTGRPTLTRLTAALGDGVRLDLTFKPEPNADVGELWDFYGRFDLTVWKP